jgi:Ca2+/Na+ antiporter
MQVLNEYSNYFKDLNFGLYYHYTNLNLVKYTAIILSIGLLLAIIGLFFKRKSERYDKSIALIVLTTFVPLILAGIISYKQKVEFYRYLSILVPFILIVIVYGISKWNSKVLTLTVTGCFIAANIFGLNLHYSFEFKNDDYRSLIDQINSEYKAGDRIYVEPHYYRWFIEYYNKQNNIPVKPVFIRYGWGEVMDSINVQKPERFWVVFDYSSVDTSKYNQYISGLNSRFKQDFNMTYYLAPVRVELYRYIKK